MTARADASAAEQTARGLLPTVMADAVRAHERAGATLAAARRTADAPAQSVALRVMGLAARARHDAVTAAEHLRAAIRVARRHALAVPEAEARMSLALVLDDLGRPAAALREADRAVAELRGPDRARAVMQRALILRRLHADEEALDGYRSALRVFRRRGDHLWEARTLTNRGVLHGYRGELRLAETDLRAAQALYTRLGMTTAAAQVEHNLGYVAAQAGDVPAALARYDRAQALLWSTGTDAVSLLDRAELLLSVRLLPEAQAAVREAISACQRGGLGSVLGQAYLMLARVALDTGAPADAHAPAAAACRIFGRQRRVLWLARARCIRSAAMIAAGRAHRGTLRDLQAAARTLTAAGWLQPGWDASIDAIVLATRLGDLDTARTLLAEVTPATRLAPARLRIRLWHATALLALRTGAPAAAARAAADGLQLTVAYRATLGATELQARTGADAAALATVRMRIALDQGRPAQLLAWSQRGRAATLWMPLARPPTDTVIARHLGELRRITAELSAAPTGPQRTGRLLRRQRVLEAEVRRRTWRTRGSMDGPLRTDVPIRDLAATLDGRVLVELVELDGDLHALVVRDRRVRHRGLAPLSAVVAELDALRFAMHRLILRSGTPASLRAATASAQQAVTALDRQLIAPLADLLHDAHLVLVPTGVLHALPWATLPGLRGRATSVAPSSTAWWRAASRPVRHGRVVLVGAPSTPHAGPEVAEIARLRPAATVRTGKQARVATVLADLDGAAVGHIAGHGEFRADNPLFSYLTLADGPLTVYDLWSIRRPPPLLILSGCETGLSQANPGDELLGLVTALQQRGTSTVIASTGPVDDNATRQLMTALHTQLVTGERPAAALAAAQDAIHPDLRTSTDTFVCFGLG